MERTGNMQILSQGGTITLMPDEQFRWSAQKIIWYGYLIVGKAIGVEVRGRLKKSTLNDNSEKIDAAQTALHTRLAEMGFRLDPDPKRYSPAAGILRQVLGCRLEGGWPESVEDQIAFVKSTIEEELLRRS